MSEEPQSTELTTEADIDKSKVIITDHAVFRFLEHRKSLGSREITNYAKAVGKIRKLFLKSKHLNAINADTRKEKDARYGERGFYFRNWRWFFVVIKAEKGFLMKTLTLMGNWTDEANSANEASEERGG